jgi:hypothetical protein
LFTMLVKKEQLRWICSFSTVFTDIMIHVVPLCYLGHYGRLACTSGTPETSAAYHQARIRSRASPPPQFFRESANPRKKIALHCPWGLYCSKRPSSQFEKTPSNAKLCDTFHRASRLLWQHCRVGGLPIDEQPLNHKPLHTVPARGGKGASYI